MAWVRKHNRTSQDVFKNMIRPKLLMALDDFMQKTVHHARQVYNYRYIDRTGALTNSKTWVPARQVGDHVIGMIRAGGVSKATQTYIYKDVFYYDEAGRLRHFWLSEDKWVWVASGDIIYVDYAVFMERKGYNVLKFSIEAMKRKAPKIIGKTMQMKNAPRPYKYKYTGEVVNLHT